MPLGGVKMTASAVADTNRVSPVAKKPTAKTDPKPSMKVFAVRLPPSISSRVEEAAKGLGLDEGNLLRMLVMENLAIYEKRAERVKSGLPAE